MKKVYPYILPGIAILLILFLAYRWYTARNTSNANKLAQFAEGSEISNLSESDVQSLRKPLKDLSTVELQSDTDKRGEIRYEIKDDKVNFSVSAELPQPKGAYQVWLKEVNGERRRKAFTLTSSKGGWMGYAAISTDTLPFEVVVSDEVNNDDQIETTVLRGVVEKPATTSASPTASPAIK